MRYTAERCNERNLFSGAVWDAFDPRTGRGVGWIGVEYEDRLSGDQCGSQAHCIHGLYFTVFLGNSWCSVK